MYFLVPHLPSCIRWILIVGYKSQRSAQSSLLKPLRKLSFDKILNYCWFFLFPTSALAVLSRVLFKRSKHKQAWITYWDFIMYVLLDIFYFGNFSQLKKKKNSNQDIWCLTNTVSTVPPVSLVISLDIRSNFLNVCIWFLKKSKINDRCMCVWKSWYSVFFENMATQISGENRQKKTSEPFLIFEHSLLFLQELEVR